MGWLLLAGFYGLASIGWLLWAGVYGLASMGWLLWAGFYGLASMGFYGLLWASMGFYVLLWASVDGGTEGQRDGGGRDGRNSVRLEETGQMCDWKNVGFGR